MYYFPNLDTKTRSIMINELERDFKNGLFYEPSSIKSEYVEGLEKALTPSFFKPKNQSGRKMPSNMATLLAFSDFNRYYIIFKSYYNKVYTVKSL